MKISQRREKQDKRNKNFEVQFKIQNLNNINKNHKMKYTKINRIFIN
jgi:hypothetical protein